MIYAGTGHRPEVLGGYDIIPKLERYVSSILHTYKPIKIISGMALGYDQALAEVAIKLDVPLIAAIPFEGQESIWPKESQQKYHNLVNKAAEVHVVCEGGFASYKYHERDKWMVAHGDAVLALWNGQKEGGTAATVRYAKKANKDVFNIWPGWESFEVEDFRDARP